MPIIELTKKVRDHKMRRALIVGGPNMYKTSSLATVPRPAFIFSYPGEEGVGAVPIAEGVASCSYETGPNELPSVVWADVEKVTFDAIAGKYGPVKSFCGDGLFQLAVLALDIASNGAFSKGEKVDPFLYPLATNRVVGYLRRVLDSAVPYAFFTCWEGKEVVDPMANVKSDAPRALYPHLPGALAKQVMGLFSVVLYCEMGPPATPGGAQSGLWRLRPNMTIKAAGIKTQVALAQGLPERVPQDWQLLEPLLLTKET